MHPRMAVVLLMMSRPGRIRSIRSRRSHQTASQFKLSKAWAEAEGT
jgi:hypothetical protein